VGKYLHDLFLIKGPLSAQQVWGGFGSIVECSGVRINKLLLSLNAEGIPGARN